MFEEEEEEEYNYTHRRNIEKRKLREHFNPFHDDPEFFRQRYRLVCLLIY